MSILELFKSAFLGTRSRRSGFTMLEIMIAISILAVAVVPSLGLNNASLSRLYQNEKEFRAILIARQVMSFFEASGRSPNPQESDGEALQIVNELGRFTTGIPYTHPNPLELDGFYIFLKVDPLQIENFPDDKLLKVSVVVSWGTEVKDSLELIHIVPKV
jgi:prepilin-type N-terminal cleavage/methylation domain-containing protein